MAAEGGVDWRRAAFWAIVLAWSLYSIRSWPWQSDLSNQRQRMWGHSYQDRRYDHLFCRNLCDGTFSSRHIIEAQARWQVETFT